MLVKSWEEVGIMGGRGGLLAFVSGRLGKVVKWGRRYLLMRCCVLKDIYRKIDVS